MSISLFFKVNRHETFRSLADFRFFSFKICSAELLVLSEHCKDDIFGGNAGILYCTVQINCKVC